MEAPEVTETPQLRMIVCITVGIDKFLAANRIVKAAITQIRWQTVSHFGDQILSRETRPYPKITEVIFIGGYFSSFHRDTVFTALHATQTRSSDENSVCPSVKRVHCDKTEGRSVQISIPYERSFSLVFWEEEWLVGSDPFTWNFGSTGPRWSEIAYLQPIFACSTSAVTRSEKVQLTLIGSPLRAFQYEPKMIIVRCSWALKGGSKAQDGRFPSKIALRLKKVCYKGSPPPKYWWGRPLIPEILDQTDGVGAKSPIFDLFSLVATQP